MAQTSSALVTRRYFTEEGTDAYDQFTWIKHDSKITNPGTGEIVFEQKDIEFPDFWSQNAINIVAQKYFYGTPGTDKRETSLKELVGRVADTITRYGFDNEYFADDAEADTFNAELKYILTSQRAAFNSPVWFNIGTPDRRQQASACFILSVDDNLPSILNWYKEEGMIFKGGSGAGVNVSKLRASMEGLSTSGGHASGPVSFMRGADASAGTIASGGKTRRAAKMVVLNIDHPDIEEFIWCKAREERKSRVLAEAGFDMGLNGHDMISIQYQNANNSVRVTDDFMNSVEKDEDWNLVGVKDKKVYKTLKARQLFREIAEASWESADPGMQFDTTVNDWHTTPNA
jgi:ribonucleoside-diphosphate reductase alpha chain